VKFYVVVCFFFFDFDFDLLILRSTEGWRKALNGSKDRPLHLGKVGLGCTAVGSSRVGRRGRMGRLPGGLLDALLAGVLGTLLARLDGLLTRSRNGLFAWLDGLLARSSNGLFAWLDGLLARLGGGLCAHLFDGFVVGLDRSDGSVGRTRRVGIARSDGPVGRARLVETVRSDGPVGRARLVETVGSDGRVGRAGLVGLAGIAGIARSRSWSWGRLCRCRSRDEHLDTHHDALVQIIAV